MLSCKSPSKWVGTASGTILTRLIPPTTQKPHYWGSITTPNSQSESPEQQALEGVRTGDSREQRDYICLESATSPAPTLAPRLGLLNRNMHKRPSSFDSEVFWWKKQFTFFPINMTRQPFCIPSADNGVSISFRDFPEQRRKWCQVATIAQQWKQISARVQEVVCSLMRRGWIGISFLEGFLTQ